MKRNWIIAGLMLVILMFGYAWASMSGVLDAFFGHSPEVFTVHLAVTFVLFLAGVLLIGGGLWLGNDS